MDNNNENGLCKKDFMEDGPVKWCAGCGGYPVLTSVQNALPQLNYKKEEFVFISGIGCSSRFPYYIKTYGFHSLHGRGAPIASGVKIANPKLSVWQVTGDGDCMAIGGNHFIHLVRRNIDINVLIFNNKIYGLTKGQYSPTTPKGSITKTSPEGTIENPFNPGELVMGAQGTFFGRAVDTDMKLLQEVMIEGARHKGTSVIEILQNCVIFNNQVHSEITGKDVRDDNMIFLENGKPMIFGKERDKGIIFKDFKLQVVKIGENGITEKDLLVHDAKASCPNVHFMLARMTLPEHPVAMGVIRSYDCTVYEDLLNKQIEVAKETSKIKNVDDLLRSGNVFEIL
ncbi:MAG: 2-oxoacid:ferredoxin oxidoreductase subunit beta [Bacteroidetes bacterium]|nr:2-oxoacid:ferredoxin oxidoreductase subunit beta [Bacteroidota bacterium]MBU1720805.1 2-oxoacid:ferredoxin oxidoreductase subunit beta [Bacteroidota bacterium]